MNDGKICVSVCAATADEVARQVKRAEELADVIEIRFDCLDEKQLMKAFALLGSRRPLLLTFRPQNQGGKIESDALQRQVFWDTFVIRGNLDARKLWFDFEYDLPKLRKISSPVTIRSFHDFSSVPADLADIYAQLSASGEVVKIAFRADDITDTIPVWKLLDRARSEGVKIIPIAMGEAGKLTRILGLARGAFMTYAALDAGGETAPGQVSACDLTGVYRAKELDEKTQVYGIIGGSTSHSMSPHIHNAAFRFHALNSVFVPLQTGDLGAFVRRMVSPRTREVDLNFRGFSVTIPHKQDVIRHLDRIDETAEKIGAVNTVKIEGGVLSGYNTDAAGFVEPLLASYGDLRAAKVAVLGAGGAARACLYALKKEGAAPVIFARDLKKAESLAAEFQVELKELPKTEDEKPKTDFQYFDILVNTTPVGMNGRAAGETPAVAAQLRGLRLVYDLIYTPFQTRLMTEADRAEVPKIGGLAMLIAQAARQQKIWTGLDAPLREMSRAALERLR